MNKLILALAACLVLTGCPLEGKKGDKGDKGDPGDIADLNFAHFEPPGGFPDYFNGTWYDKDFEGDGCTTILTLVKANSEIVDNHIYLGEFTVSTETGFYVEGTFFVGYGKRHDILYLDYGMTDTWPDEEDCYGDKITDRQIEFMIEWNEYQHGVYSFDMKRERFVPVPGDRWIQRFLMQSEPF